jgi:YidC/Oxa1 family membrane protein insertase
MDDQNRRLLLATVLSMGVLLIWYTLFPPAPPPEAPAPTELAQGEPATPGGATTPPGTGGGTPPDVAVSAERSRAEALAAAPRIAIDTPRLIGSLSLVGGRIDDLSLKDYRETVDPDSPLVKLFSPQGAPNAYYAMFGWTGGPVDPALLPGTATDWAVETGDTLSVGAPVTLVWDNGAGLIFRRTISIDEDYMFTVDQSVENVGDMAVSMRPYGLLRRHGEPADMKNFFILHEGMVRASDGELEEASYDDMTDYTVDVRESAPAERIEVQENGWIGFTDHYWMTTLVPMPGTPFRSTAKYFERSDLYEANVVLPELQVAPGETAAIETRLFAGAKEWEALRYYQNDPGSLSRLLGAGPDPDRPQIDRFVDAIDWGWFWFLTKPIFLALHWLHGFIGNMGWSIIGLTLFLKVLLFPLAYKSYASMAKMKELQPEMEKLKERAGDDRQKLQVGMMELYKKEKVNPAAGCLPILLQIPIFFSLYKVIFVTIELRHAAWFGPFRDLSAPDPTSIANLFGLLPWGAPVPGSFLALILIGILPLMLGITMWLQMKLNPAPTDPTQAMIFNWMPWVFMFMLGGFASGLVLYWISNNVITFVQQYAIMRSHGYKPDVFGNIKASVKKPKPKAEPDNPAPAKAAPAAEEPAAPNAADADADAEAQPATRADDPAKPAPPAAAPRPHPRTQQRRKKSRARRRKG